MTSNPRLIEVTLKHTKRMRFGTEAFPETERMTLSVKHELVDA
jgi:hypothetical protein